MLFNSNPNSIEWIAREKTISHKFCSLPSSYLGDMQLLFLAKLTLVKSEVNGFVWNKRSGDGIKTWSWGKNTLAVWIAFICHGYFSSLLIQNSYGALVMSSQSACWQNRDFYAGLYSNQLSIRLFLPSHSFICILYIGRWLSIFTLPFYSF